jgi:hypothetical protein
MSTFFVKIIEALLYYSLKCGKPIKNINIEDYLDFYLDFYLDLRDRYRWELVALRYMGEPATSGMQVNDLFITPGCYFRFRANWQNNIVENIHPHQFINRKGVRVACRRHSIQTEYELVSAIGYHPNASPLQGKNRLPSITESMF